MVPVLSVCVGSLNSVGCFFFLYALVSRPMAAVSDRVFSGDDGMDIKICPLMSQLDCVSNCVKDVQTLSHDDRNVHTLIHKCTL